MKESKLLNYNDIYIYIYIHIILSIYAKHTLVVKTFDVIRYSPPSLSCLNDIKDKHIMLWSQSGVQIIA